MDLIIGKKRTVKDLEELIQPSSDIQLRKQHREEEQNAEQEQLMKADSIAIQKLLEKQSLKTIVTYDTPTDPCAFDKFNTSRWASPKQLEWRNKPNFIGISEAQAQENSKPYFTKLIFPDDKHKDNIDKTRVKEDKQMETYFLDTTYDAQHPKKAKKHVQNLLDHIQRGHAKNQNTDPRQTQIMHEKRMKEIETMERLKANARNTWEI